VLSATDVANSSAFSSTIGAVSSAFSSMIGPLSASVTASSVKLLGVFNVREYGAKGDNVTDDAAAFSATISASYAYALSMTGATGAEVDIPPGWYNLGSTIDWTRGDIWGTSGTVGYDGYGRIRIRGFGRNQTVLSLSMGTGSDGMVIGGYTNMVDLGIVGTSRNTVVAHQNTGSFAGRSAERLKMDRIFLRASVDSAGTGTGVSLDVPAGFFMELDTVQALAGVSCRQGGLPGDAVRRVSYDSLFENCEIGNSNNPNVNAIDWNGSGLTVIGGIVYTANSSVKASLYIDTGGVVLIGTDFDYTAVSSVSGYDIVVAGTGASPVGTGASVTTIGCSFPSRASISGTTGNILIKSGSVGGTIMSSHWSQGAAGPSIHIETGTFGVSIIAAEISSSNLVFLNGGSMATFSGTIIVKDKSNLDTKSGAASPAFSTLMTSGTSAPAAVYLTDTSTTRTVKLQITNGMPVVSPA